MGNVISMEELSLKRVVRLCREADELIEGLAYDYGAERNEMDKALNCESVGKMWARLMAKHKLRG